MAITLGKNPASFKKPLKLISIEGVEDTLVLEFKFRTRLQFATLTDQRAKQDKEREAAPTEAGQIEKSIEQQVLENLDIATDRVLEIAQGWDLPDAFNKESLSILEGMYPTVLGQIQDMYQASVLEARRKN